MSFFNDPSVAYVGIAVLVFAGIVLFKVFSKIISKFG